MPEESSQSKFPGILLVPGLGGDSDMFLPILSHLIRRKVPFVAHSTDPVLMEVGDDLVSYAKRFFMENQIMQKRFSMVLGISMGGMIAQIGLEKGWIQTDKLVLISTVTSGKQLTRLSIFGANLLRFVPVFFRKPLVRLAGFLYPILRFSYSWAGVIGEMVKRANSDLIFLAPKKIQSWRKNEVSNLSFLPYLTVTFHGKRDPLLSWNKVNRERKVDYSYEGGSHLIFLSKSREISRVIEALVYENR